LNNPSISAVSERERVRGLAAHYRTERHNLARDFFAPCLAAFSRYRRAAGFFSSSALRTWAACLPRLAAETDVRIQLLISPEISATDAQALTQTVNEADRQRLLASSVEHFVRDVFEFQQTSSHAREETLRGQLLAWLIVQGRLEVRFAVNLHKDRELGIFHKKIGIFDYPWGDCIAFTGSANESTSAHEINSESVEVYRSWIESDRERIETKIEEFEEAWAAKCPNLKVLPLSIAALEYIRTIAPEHPPDLSGRAIAAPAANPPAVLWPHQQKAVDRFLESGHGILEMATGTGKTRTALAIAAMLRAQGKIESIIVAMEGTDLLKQWYADLCQWAEANAFPSVHRHFEVFHDREDYLLEPRNAILLASRSALEGVFKQLRKMPRVPTLIIHDEVHDLGSPGGVAKLGGQPELFSMRLGLSATPDRAYDAEGTAFIEQEIGPVVFRFGIEDAIRDRILCPFRYVALPYQLTEEDKQDLVQVRRREAAAKHNGQPWTKEQLWIELSRVYKKAREKLPAFARFLSTQPPDFLKWSILFVEDRDYANELYPIIHQRTHRFSCYYAEDQADVLRRFIAGDLDCLITCHKISQGIDIRALEKVILFASASARLETIQRLGRCLRTNKEQPDKVATVIDFVLANENGEPDPEGVDYERYVWFQKLASITPETP
jgi:superfamily II DNA or RNA helicase